jgi:hypothetical protein
MEPKRPSTALFFSFIPGLGQVYCGTFLRGLAFLGGIFLCLILFDFSFWDIGGFSLPDPYILLYVVLLIWAGSAADAYLLVKDRGSELPEQETPLLHYIAYLILVAIIVTFGVGIFFILTVILGMAAMFSGHEPPPGNITITAEKIGDLIILQNVDGAPSSYTGLWVSVNGMPLNETLNLSKGSLMVVNGTAREDHVRVMGCWVYGGCSTMLDTVV